MPSGAMISTSPTLTPSLSCRTSGAISSPGDRQHQARQAGNRRGDPAELLLSWERHALEVTAVLAFPCARHAPEGVGLVVRAEFSERGVRRQRARMVGRPMWAKTKRRTLFLRLAGDFCDAISRFEQ